MRKIESLHDLMDKIDWDCERELVLFINPDVFPLLKKMGPDFQSYSNYLTVLETGKGFIGFYHDNYVYLHKKVPKMSIHWADYDSYLEKLEYTEYDG